MSHARNSEGDSRRIGRSETCGGAVLRRAGATAFLWLFISLLPRPSFAGVDDILEAVRQSEFRFARYVAEVPFIPVGWAQYRYYPETEFKEDSDVLPPAEVSEQAFSLGAVVPVHVGKRDMYLLGGEVGRDDINVHVGPYQNQRIARVTPVAAWMHQFGTDETLGVFVAPILSKEQIRDQPWAVNGFSGVIGIHWYSDTLQWLYGGVYEYSFGEDYLYPYLGLQWIPSPKVVLALIYPWPTLTYTPADRWLLQMGISPGGSTWVSRGDGFESTQSLNSWNFTVGAAYRLSGPYWLFAGAGVTGLRGLTSNRDAQEIRFEAQSSPVYTIAIQFRP